MLWLSVVGFRYSQGIDNLLNPVWLHRYSSGIPVAHAEVSTMYAMFFLESSFNQTIGAWDVSNGSWL
jgi:hypothetical protein